MSENGMAKSVGFSIVRMIKNYFLLSVIIGLLVTNVASIISSPFNNSMFRLLSHLPFSEFLSNSPSIQQKRLIASYKQMTKRNLTLSKKLHVPNYAA